jgi:hypothetical protein
LHRSRFTRHSRHTFGLETEETSPFPATFPAFPALIRQAREAFAKEMGLPMPSAIAPKNRAQRTPVKPGAAQQAKAPDMQAAEAKLDATADKAGPFLGGPKPSVFGTLLGEKPRKHRLSRRHSRHSCVRRRKHSRGNGPFRCRARWHRLPRPRDPPKARAAHQPKALDMQAARA